MKVTFLGQGFTTDVSGSVGQRLISLFESGSFKSFTGISAFASEAGVNGLASCLLGSSGFDSINIIIGIDQEGTSKEALEEILKLDVNSYIFYQREQPIFHPKIYLFEGESKSALIIGSSNLTGRGMFSNVESSLLIEFELGNADGETLLEELKGYFENLFNFSDPNLFKISQKVIDDFVELGVVPEKAVWIAKQRKKISVKSEKESLDVPKRATAKLPASFRGKPKQSELIDTFVEEVLDSQDVEGEGRESGSTETGDIFEETSTDNYRQVYLSKPLTERDLNIPSGENTNATGSMLLKKGRMVNVDQRHYFRDVVFSGLNWTVNPVRAHLENTSAKFKIFIDGEDMGEHRLVINHNNSTDTTSYLQNNAMSNIRWGEARDLIAKPELLGKILKMFKAEGSNDEFKIEIEDDV